MVNADDIAHRLFECGLLQGNNVELLINTLRDGRVLMIRNRENGVQRVGAYPHGVNLNAFFSQDEIRE